MAERRVPPAATDEPGGIVETLQALVEREVPFLVAGGVAAQLYGSRRLTMDLDLIPSLRGRDWRALLDALEELGFAPQGAEWEEILNVHRLRKWARPRDLISLRFRRDDPPLDVDLLFGEGDRFDRYAAHAKRAVDGDLAMLVVGKDDLIEMKRRAGRPTDLMDIAAMEGA